MEEQVRHYANKLVYETDSWDLKVALESGENVVVIDARSPEVYQREHIPGAVNIPHREMSEETTKHIDKAALVVTYCDGIGCNASTKGALNMARLGFHVKELLGGLDWWLRDGYATEGAASNLFAVINGVITTPPKGPILLPGITRDLILELAANNNMSHKESSISLTELQRADEIWLTSSTKEILSVTQLDGKSIADGKPGPLYRRMLALYQDYKQALRNQQ